MLGDRGPAVRALQVALQAVVPGLVVDGVYGVKTERARRVANAIGC